VAAVREDAGVMAVVKDLECRLVAAPELSDETFVPEGGEQLPRPRDRESAVRTGERRDPIGPS
jgi:hypothetical protein